MADKDYLIVYTGMAAIPATLRDFVEERITKELEPFDVELDFSGRRKSRDLLVRFTDEVPVWSMFGESSRMAINKDLEPGDSIVYVGLMKAMRLQTASGACEPAFAPTKDALGTMIANTAVHETAHMLGLDQGGYDQGGHVADKDNFMWMSTVKHKTRVSQMFEYTVKRGDTLSAIVQRHKIARLHPCRHGPTLLDYFMVWQDPENKKDGFVAHPKKSGHAGRRANDPNWIYPGEKVALMDHSFRTQKYRAYFPGWLGKKKFSDAQVKTMKSFIAGRMAAGKG